MKEYKVSVITPFHNVDMGMFQKAYESIKAQTIGFENIQWIVVVHNCEPHYMPLLQNLLGKYDNILVKELNNDAKTPSSPRNYGVTFATAPYIGYLDGDDSFTLNCLEVASREMKETKSQVVCFRREFELAEEGLVPLIDSTLWNNALPRIVIEQGHWDDKIMFSGMMGFVTSRLFDRQFLIDNQITFDETVPFAEDILYVIETIAAAKRLCYLPQLIGYHYYINGGSLVQNNDKSGETLISYAKGFVKIYQTARKYGIKDPDYEQLLCAGLSIFVLNSPRATAEDRRQIKDLLSPFINSFSLLPPSKIHSAEDREMSFRLPREVLLNPDNPKKNTYVLDMLDGQRELMTILHENKETDYGQTHAFGRIETLQGYQYRTPLTHYPDYDPLIKLQTNVGETGILVKDKIDCYLTTEDGKILPCTSSHLEAYTTAFSSMLAGRHNLLIAGSRPTEHRTNDQADIDTLESMLVKEFFTSHFFGKGRLQAEFTSPVTCYFMADTRMDYYRLMYDALKDKEVDQIVAMTTVEVVNAFHTLEQQWSQMVEMLRKDGHEERAAEVEAILKDGFDKPVAQYLWPELKRIVAFGAGELYESCQEIKRYTGSVPHNHGYYYTEEAILGKAIADDNNLFECIRGNNFYELIPILADSQDTPLKWSQVETGKPYQLVVTNHAGLYRYVTDHFVCPKQIDHTNILFSIY